MVQAMALHPEDTGVSWLPLFHDMGLVGGLLSPLVAGFPLHLMTPGEFLLHPGRWIQRFADVRGTVCAAPDFAWRLAARRVTRFEGDLSAWRIGLDGAEPVHRGTLDGFVERFAPNGFAATTLRPAYGLAENTLAAAIYDPAHPAPDRATALRRVPSVGAPIPGVEVRVLRAEGGLAAEGEEGAIHLRSGSLMRGYFRDEAASAAALVDGWLTTGDLGLVHGGQLYVTGRAKELLIQNGSKFHPYDLERAATDAVEAAMAGAAAFATPGPEGERLVIAVEVPAAFTGDVVRTVRGRILDELGVRVDVVLPVAPGELPRTTSGKVRRSEAATALRSRVDG
jgi:acyl-CoA synthetase (AMP-forming)/AMP-acid ligase II